MTSSFFTHRFGLSCLAFFLAAAGLTHAADLGTVGTFYVDQSSRPDARSLVAFDLCILQPHAEVDMEPGHALGSRYLALLDVTHARTGSREAMLIAERSVASKPHATDKRVRVVDPADPRWIAWVVEAQTDPVAKKGFDGFVLSLGDMKADPAARASVLALAATLRQRYSDKAILLDFRIGLGAEAIHVTDGFLALGVYTREGRDGSIDWTPVAETQQIARGIRAVEMQGMHVFAVDFAPQSDRDAAREAVKRLTATGALPFITTPELNGVNLGPLEEISRRVLVLHGWDEKHTGQDAPAAEATLTSRVLRQSLEWLGCDLDFRLARGADFLPQDHNFAAVILDPGLVLDAEQQRALAAWLPSLRTKKIPLLLTSMPFTNEAARHLALQHLKLGGSMKPVSALAKTNIAGIDSTLLVKNARPQARALGFLELSAPSDAHIVLALRGEDALGGEHRFDQTFLASWGAACLDNLELAAAELNLPAFLATWLDASNAPVPDTTTREGRRVFYSHIDSTGFSTPSTLPGYPLCAEVMRNRILDRYMLPVTVSVCEADLRCWLPGQQAKDAPLLEHIARSIFEMPQVQVASNSFSRPKTWTAGKDIASRLNERAKTSRLDMEREIAGSMIYIHRRLLPLGKDVNLMLWPQSTTPTAEALRFCESLNIAQLSGATQAVPMHKVTGSLEGGATRLEPLAVRCSFDDVRTEKGVTALEKTFDACAGEPLHTMTAAAYARSVSDARATRILRVADRHWIILNGGECRTLRLPASAGVPDMTRCAGVSGYNTSGGQLYVHTMGNARTELVLTTTTPAQHIHLAESSAAVEFMDLSSRRATFHVRDLRPVEMVFGGFEPRGQCAYLENGRPYTVTADTHGRVHLEIVCRATVTLQSLPPAAHAAMR
ncbi:MAG: hypothetical protein U1F71_10150 [Verrucomicrobiaceae bacterium]